MRNALYWYGIVMMVAGCTQPVPNPVPTRWAAYYDRALPATAFAGQDLVVFDRLYYPEDFALLQPETTVLAYVSMGEVHGFVPENKKMREAGAILLHNPKWDSDTVDLTHPAWQETVLDAVADAERKGFDGVMLDTVESPLIWAAMNAPARHPDMQRAAVQMIKKIHEDYPNMRIMLNRAFDILPQVAHVIDFSLAESIMTHPNDSTGQFKLLPITSYSQVAKKLHRVVAIAPQLQVFTLDYWNTDDVKGLERIYATQRASGFIPYATSLDLRNFTPEPGFERPH